MADVRKGKVPLVGGGTSTFSFVHTRDVATAVAATLEKRPGGAINIVDDTPVKMAAWLPELAHMLDARPPKHAPSALARMAVGGWGVAFMTQLRGASNSWAKAELGWRPQFATWQDGFRHELEMRVGGRAAK